jgi:regulator of protease activity HflC (stomatin/prohibitin superfamily)
MIFSNFLTVLTVAVWAVFLGVIALGLFRTARTRGPGRALRQAFSLRLQAALFLAATATTLARSGLVFIEPQEVAVVISAISPEGYRERPLRSGLRWLTPLAEEVVRYPISWQTYRMGSRSGEGQVAGDDSILARTSDGQEVSIDSSVIFLIDAEEVMRVHIEWRDRYVNDVIRPVMRGLVRSQVSQFTVDEVNSSKRLDLERDLDKQVRLAFKAKGFILDRFILLNIAFSPEYAAAVEQKQIAFQGKIESEYKADAVRKLAQGEADATRMKAQAQAEALEAISRALARDRSLLTYQYIDKLSPAIRVMLVPNNAPFMLPLPSLDEPGAPSTLRPLAPVPAAPAPPAPALPSAAPPAPQASAAPRPGP